MREGVEHALLEVRFCGLQQALDVIIYFYLKVFVHRTPCGSLGFGNGRQYRVGQSCLARYSSNRLDISAIDINRNGFLNEINANDKAVVFLFFDQDAFGTL